jgi:hypothetical protein
MSLILSGTDGLSDVDGSAATPAIRGTDANTGMFFPAADTIAFSEGGVESMRLNSSGVLVTTNDASISGLTVGKGNGSVVTNTAAGYLALNGSNSGVGQNSAFGYQALFANTTGNENTAIGTVAAYSNTTGRDNTVVGDNAFYTNTTGSNNTAIGRQALQANTTASNNTAVGYQALYTQAAGGANNTALGYQAGYSAIQGSNTFIGYKAGYLSTGYFNTFVGTNECGSAMTTGFANTIIGRYTGNQGGLDIRTASNYIVLSDGDGNPRGYFNNNGDFFPQTRINLPGSISTAGQANFNNCSTLFTLASFPLSNQTIFLQGATDNLSFSSDKVGVGNIFNMSTDGVTAIRFAATQVASANANTLDDYEEGTFTPNLLFGGGNTGMTFFNRQGSYTKVGTVVTIQIGIYINSKGSSTGVVSISNAPFATPNAGFGSYGGIIYGQSGMGASGMPYALVEENSTTIKLYYSNVGGETALTNSTIANYFQLSITYRSAS